MIINILCDNVRYRGTLLDHYLFAPTTLAALKEAVDLAGGN